MVDYRKSFKVEANSIIKIKGVNCDMYNDILPFIKQMKYKSTGREIILYDGSDLKLALSKGLLCDDGVYRFCICDNGAYRFCNDIYLILEVNSDYIPLDLEYDFNVATILETVSIDTMYNTYLKLECNEYDFETYYNKIRFIIYTLYISLSADYVIETLLSKVKSVEKEIGELRKVD